MAARILGSTVHHEIGAQIEWALVHWGSRGAVHHEHTAGVMDELTDCGDIVDFEGQIIGALDQPRLPVCCSRAVFMASEE